MNIFSRIQKEASDQRDLLIAYKQTFGSASGKLVLIDLMNRNYILNSHQGDPLCEGRRAAVLEVLEKTNINLGEFDKMLKGESE